MTRRHKFLTILFMLAVAAITLASILRDTDMRTQYGMTRLHLPHQTVYVKARACGAACAGELWLSLNSDRCQPPNPATDYGAPFGQLFYAIDGDTLALLASPAAVTEPTGPKWLHLKLLPRFGHAADAYPLHYIQFREQLPERNVPGETVDLSPCVRAFGHDW